MTSDEHDSLVRRPDLVVDITLYPTSKGGRRTPIQGRRYGCPCKFHPEDATAWDGVIFPGDQIIAPGETKRFGMYFLTPEVAPLFRKVAKFYLWESGIIGEAVPVAD